MTYFVISNSDGDTHINPMSKDELLKNLKENYWGDECEVRGELPRESDTNYWGDSIVIIKGEVVAPTPKKVVEEYDID